MADAKTASPVIRGIFTAQGQQGIKLDNPVDKMGATTLNIQAAMHRPHANALLLNAEIAAVVTAMRQNSKWALIPTRYTVKDDEIGDDPLLDDFKMLRRRIFQWQDWKAVNPMEYLAPFLEVIRSPETSGPITGVALTSVRRMLDNQVLLSDVGTADAMHATADAVTQCKFEATDPASDEVVLFKILQVLLSCVRCPSGELLTNDNVINIFQACFRIGHYQTERSKDMSELLTQASRQIMVEMVAIIFARLAKLPDEPVSPSAMHPHMVSPRLAVSPKGHTHVDPASLPFESGRADMHVGESNGIAADAAAAAAPPATDAAAAAQAAVEGGDAGGGEAGGKPAGGGDAAAAQAVEHHTVSVAAPAPIRSKAGAGDGTGHGMESVLEIVGFLISLIMSEGEGVHTDLNEFGLELMNIALNAGGPGFVQHEALPAMLQEDLFPAMLAAARSPNLACLSGVCQLALSLYVHLGRGLLLQLEAFVATILLRLAEGKGTTKIEQQEAALEGLLDLCNQPSFIRNMYLNLDCRVERENLFEGIAALLSKTAFPVNSPLGSVHLLSLEGLFSILSALATGCTGASAWDSSSDFQDPEQYVDIWGALVSGGTPPVAAATRSGEPVTSVTDVARVEKYVKSRLQVAADMFNRDYKKGFQFLQTINLLPKDLTSNPAAVARFLRACPGLSKSTIGELLGENDDFFLRVLDEFTQTFRFEGMDFVTAIRTYLESFRLPGEAQKINRIMESFGKLYHAQSGATFKSADAVYVLGYSVIMLNTDQHNNQVKKKMTSDEFVRNNRGINDGDSLPEDYLRAIYDSISRSEIRITSEAASSMEVSPVLWAELHRVAGTPRGQMVEVPLEGCQKLDRDMFVLMWGPTVAAVSVVLDHADDPGMVGIALDGLMHAAKMASYHHVDEVMDNLVVSLSKYTAMLNPAAAKPIVAFGQSEKARLAAETVFTLANRYGDCLRSGWRNIMDCVVRLHKLGLLPPAVLAMEAEDAEGAAAPIPRPSASNRSASAGSLLSRAFNSLISIDGADNGVKDEASQREREAAERTVECIEACAIEDIFADSKFLRAESLLQLVKALMWASGPVHRAAATGEDTATAELCLELLFTIALRNRDRIGELWPLIHDYLGLIMNPEIVKASNPLVQRAALGVLRVAQRLLPYKEDASEALLRSLQLVPRMNPNVAWELAEPIAVQVLALLKSSAAHIRSVRGWHTVCALITTTSLHPDASATAFDALGYVCWNQKLLSLVNFGPCQETAMVFVERHAKDPLPENSVKALDMMENMFNWLITFSEANAASGAGEAEKASNVSLVAEQYLALLNAVAKVSLEPNKYLRNHAIVILQRMLVASEALGLWGSLWVQTISDLLVPLVGNLAGVVAGKQREYHDADKTLRMAVNMLTKTVLQYLLLLTPEPDFPDMWQRVLLVLQDCTQNRSEELKESVPEALKNMLVVMAARGVLSESWKDGNGESLWELTWARAKEVSSGLSPAVLAHSGISAQPSGTPRSLRGTSVEASPRSPSLGGLAHAPDFADQSPSDFKAAIQAAQRELAGEAGEQAAAGLNPSHERLASHAIEVASPASSPPPVTPEASPHKATPSSSAPTTERADEGHMAGSSAATDTAESQALLQKQGEGAAAAGSSPTQPGSDSRLQESYTAEQETDQSGSTCKQS